MAKFDTVAMFNKLKERIPRLVTLFGILILTVFVMYTILPTVDFLKTIRLSGRITMYETLRVLLPGLTVYIIFEISKQIGPLLDEFSSYFVYSLPGMRRLERVSIKRIRSDITYIIVAILINSYGRGNGR